MTRTFSPARATRRVTSRGVRAVFAALALLLAAVSGSSAQTSPNTAEATRLFDSAQPLMAAKNYAAACDAYQRSQALDPQLGTLLHLADCQELLGHTADAYRNFTAAAAIAADRTRAGRPEPREQVARKRADHLKGQLAWLHIVLPPSPSGANVTLDGANVDASFLREAQAIEPGAHAVAVEADAYTPWSQAVRLEPGSLLDLEVPALQPIVVASPTPAAAVSVAPPAALPEPSPAPPASPAAISGNDVQRITAFVIGGIGVAGLGTSIFLGARQSHFVSQLHELCPDKNQCGLSAPAYARFQSIDGKARDYAAAFNWTLALSAAMVTGGIALYVTAPRAEPNELRVSAGLGSIVVSGDL